ncbi:DNA recombination protein RmuC [candidate division WS5 bacterium]|uniref:DNA recombination protein RmuC n=1 Tax=candidate division WS5 bacterium TaxID=2093353 RepID=A0A419DCS3_9BACT|nr:MAG: DNA recombination protein RmuC [candidate division WS5 bacterium]
MDQNIVLILAGLIVAGFVAIAVFINKKMAQISSAENNKDLDRIHERLDRQFEASSKIIRDVTEKLSKLENTNTQIVGITEQLQGLEDVLKNPKQRGILGEYYLETLLKNLFQPNQYQMQYSFKDGDIVDAVIKIKDKVIPIDSKFSLENYNKIAKEKDSVRRAQLEKLFKQDLKNRIDETAKYIKPKEGTMDFAFMFIPSEGIYYDLLVNQVGALKVNTRDLIEYAFKEKKVIIVSPTSFAAYLQTVLQGLRALTIEESIKDIVQNIHKLGNHLNSYEEYMAKLGSNLGTTVGMYNKAYKEFGKIDKDVTKITGESIDVEVLEIDKPRSE